jgi:arylsulfatase A-like enzyme
MEKRPNIVLIIPHDLGTHLSCYGEASVKSPHLDALAAEGVLFTNHFCASTPCSPARGCMMTGRYAHSNGLMGLVNRGWSLPDSEKTLVDYLNEQGYLTFCCGGQHERRNPSGNRYRKLFMPPDLALCDLVYPEAIRFLSSEEAKVQPFFMSLFSFETHLPHAASDLRKLSVSRHIPDWPLHEASRLRVPGWLHDNENTRRGLAKFHGQIEFFDRWCGEFLETLREQGFSENTVVIFTTDHGAALPGAKGMLTDPGTRISLIMRFPDSWGIEARRLEALSSSIDVLPTLLEMLGVQVDDAVQGKSHWKLLKDGNAQELQSIYLEKNFHDRYDPKRAVRSGRYKYVRNYVNGPKITLPMDVALGDAGRDLSPDSIQSRSQEELYDLESDPAERVNLIGDGNNREVLEELRHDLRRWMEQTQDPLLQVPEGAVLPYPREQWI